MARGLCLGLPFAGVDLFSLCALLAFDVAAPAHLALTGPRHHSALGVVAPPTADGVTVLVFVALACRCARRVFAGPAETGRVLDVEQVHGTRDLVVGTWHGLLLLGSARGYVPLPGGLVGGAAHLHGGLVALF